MRIQRSSLASGRLARTVGVALCVAVGGSAVWLIKSPRILQGLTGIRAPHAAQGTPAPRLEGTTKAHRPSGNPRLVRTSGVLPAGFAKTYGRLPLSFEPNFGQTDPQVKYLTRGSGYAMFLTPSEAVFELKDGDAKRQADQRGARPSKSWSPAGERAEVVRMKLVGGNPSPVMAGLDELPGKTNYFIGNDPAKWRTNISNYRKVAEREVYPGIDLIYYGNQRQLEYDFVVAPGADPRAIRFKVEGAKKLRTDSTGDLKVEMAGGELRLHKPAVYQKADGLEQPVEGRYVLEGTHEVAFKVGGYDAKRALVIDPILSYSTYLGGSQIDGANAIAAALDGTAFVAGGTASTDFPVAHSLQTQTGGPRDFPQDAFVSKIAADGSALLYSTYLGGGGPDQANGIAVDTFGDAYVVGTTVSVDYPHTAGAWDPNCSSDGQCGGTLPGRNGAVDSDGFLTKLDPAGAAIIYSGFIGGDGDDLAFAVAVDLDQNVYVTGQTNYGYGPGFPACPGTTTTVNGVMVTIYPPCAPFPITGDAFQQFPFGAPEPFMIKISSSGSSILYSTLLGGDVEDIGTGIAVDNSGNAYVTGLTYSPNFFPVTQPAVLTGPQVTIGSHGNTDAFMVKINTLACSQSPFITAACAAASDAYATYLGGDGIDRANGIAIDIAGNVYITGETTSTSPPFPTTAGSLQTACALDALGVCEGDVFVTKLNPSVSGVGSLVYSTYLGGTHADAGQGIAVDPAGNAYITGFTNSTDFPVTGGLLQHTYGGGNTDAFVAKVNPAGSALVYSTFLGGSNADIGYGIAVDGNGNALVGGQTCSTDFPTAAPVQPSQHGNCDAFVSKIAVGPSISVSPASLSFPAQPIGTTSSPQTVTVTSDGDTSLLISTVTVTGDFAETDNCAGATLAVETTCTINVTFTPTQAGNRNGSISIADNAPGSPHTVNLEGGAGSTFTISVSPSSQSVFAGTPASYTITVTPFGGFNQTVTLGCAGLPPLASCTVTPGAVTPDGINPATASAVVTTMARTLAPPVPNSHPPAGPPLFVSPWLLGALGLASLTVLGLAKRRRAWVGLGIALCFVTLWVACGGTSLSPSSGTPAGSYTLTISGTAASVTHTSGPVTLTVK